MSQIDRDSAARLGQSVVMILQRGGYTAASGREVNIRALDSCRAATVEFLRGLELAAQVVYLIEG